MSFHTGTIIKSPSGASLHIRFEAAEGTAKAVFLLSHGFAEHSARYAPLAGFLSARGYHVYALDHRGHGFTTAPDAERGRFARADGAAKVVADVASLRAHAADAHPGLPFILFGHSMGGVIAALAAETRPELYDALCIWNSDLNPGLAGKAGIVLLKLEKFFKGSDVPSVFGPRLTFDTWANTITDARTNFDWLSHDEEEVTRYIADPLCGFDCSVSMWIDVIGMCERAGRRDSLARLPKLLPVHLVGGGEDPATANGKVMQWLAARMRSLDITNVHLTIYPHMRHETLNEIGREQAFEALAAWADGVLANSESA